MPAFASQITSTTISGKWNSAKQTRSKPRFRYTQPLVARAFRADILRFTEKTAARLQNQTLLKNRLCADSANFLTLDFVPSKTFCHYRFLGSRICRAGRNPPLSTATAVGSSHAALAPLDGRSIIPTQQQLVVSGGTNQRNRPRPIADRLSMGWPCLAHAGRRTWSRGHTDINLR